MRLQPGQCPYNLHLTNDFAHARTEDRMTSRKRIGLIGFLAACAVSIVCAVYMIAEHKASNDVHAAGDRQLQIIALDLESVLEKFETLPFTLAFHPDVAEVLARPKDAALIEHVNLTLQTIQRHAKVDAIYLMDREGLTLASSNWDEPLTFVGRTFAYRPYFREAVKGNPGRFYGIGSATSEPGYFIAKPVYSVDVAPDNHEPIGVITVKISLAEFERTWSSSEEALALTDSSGVVFLSNRPSWRYHSMHSLDQTALEYVRGTLQYVGQTIKPISSLPSAEQAGFGEYVSKPVGRLGWQLMMFPSQKKITRTAMFSALAAALLLAIAGSSYWAVHQRRRRLEERTASRKVLQQVAEELDRTIAQRTQELLEANQHLETRYAKLKETEHLLRSTQN
jgi:two-component system C4-dicarboxylate transport sensor histidine kinase DctB